MENIHDITYKKWFNIELNKEQAEKLTAFLKEYHISYESSGIDSNFRHIEIYADESQRRLINRFMYSNF